MEKYIYSSLQVSMSKFIVIYDYSPHSADELQVKAGDVVKLEKKLGWWAKVITDDNRRGYLPRTYLAEPNSLDAKPWYFPETSRAEANHLLSKQQPGTYLVRQASSDKDYALCIRTSNPEKPIAHYKIYYDDKKGFFIQKNLAETSLSRLLSYYQNQSRHLLSADHRLVEPCHKSPPRIYQLIPKDIPIECHEITKLKEMGSGHFSKVYSGFFRQYKIAIKELKSDDSEALEKEISVLKNLHHKNVITFYGFCKKKSWMVLEFADFCLKNELQAKRYNNHQLLSIAIQITRGMAYIHSMKYIHRDLAARNILITFEMVAKISDFGLSRKLARGTYVRSNHSTPIRWEAIESLAKGIYNKATDVWSFGVLMIELYIEPNRKLYENLTGRPQLQLYLDRGDRLAKPELMPQELYNIAYKCWHGNPKKRPSFAEIYELFSNQTGNASSYLI